jgi:hypothetical protein
VEGAAGSGGGAMLDDPSIAAGTKPSLFLSRQALANARAFLRHPSWLRPATPSKSLLSAASSRMFGPTLRRRGTAALAGQSRIWELQGDGSTGVCSSAFSSTAAAKAPPPPRKPASATSGSQKAKPRYPWRGHSVSDSGTTDTGDAFARYSLGVDSDASDFDGIFASDTDDAISFAEVAAGHHISPADLLAVAAAAKGGRGRKAYRAAAEPAQPPEPVVINPQVVAARAAATLQKEAEAKLHKEEAEARGDADAAAAMAEDDPDTWPALRRFEIDNTEGYIEPGKKAPRKKRDITIIGLGIPPLARTVGGWPQVNGAVLKALAGKVEGSSPVYGPAYEYFGGGEDGKEACEALHSLFSISAIDTMLSNFIIPLQIMADANQRVHCSLNLNTETGRLSARRPNLQNQPALEKDKYGVRKAFGAAPGNKLVVADYGQLELRLLAHMANCRSMLTAFEAGGDFHSRTAMGMYDHVSAAVDKSDVLLEWDDEKNGPAPKPLLKNVFASERRKAKILNFSIAYGKTAMGLSRDWNVSMEEAQETVNKWYGDRPEVKNWQKRVLEEAKRTQTTRTLLGRYRDLPDIVSSDFRARGHAERAAINTPIQGGAADVAMAAMLKIWRNERLKELGWKLLLQIHDEVILEGPAESADEALQLTVADMRLPFDNPLLVELVVDAKIVDTWYEAK